MSDNQKFSKDRPRDYSKAAKAFHWLTSVLIFIMIPLGFYMVWLENSPFKFDLYQWHKSIGMTILLIVILRLGWSLSKPRPSPEPGLRKWEIRLSKSVHVFLYFVLFAMPLTGWLLTSASDFPNRYFGLFQIPDLFGKDEWLYEVMSEAHEIIAFIILGLVTLHVAGAFKHYIIDRDGTLQKMLPATGKKVQSAFAFSALGIMICSFLISFGLIYQNEVSFEESHQSSPAESAQKISGSPARDTKAVNSDPQAWKIVSEKSRIGFEVEVYGEPFSGEFKDYSGDIVFNPQSPESSHAHVEVTISSVESGNSERDGYIIQEPWLYAKKYPEARFTSHFFEKIEKAGSRNSAYQRADYVVRGALTLRGVTKDISMPFTFRQRKQGERTFGEAKGTFTIRRQDFKIGQGPWAQGETVGEQVKITVELEAVKDSEP